MTADRLPHAAAPDLDRLAAGAPAEPALAAHLAVCPDCRRALAGRDPTALFALLPALPDPVPAPPYRRPARASRRTLRRAALAAAAALAFAAALWAARPPVSGGLRAGAPEVPAYAPPPAPVVRRVDSRAARVVTLLPPDGHGPTVTLLLDTELDL